MTDVVTNDHRSSVLSSKLRLDTSICTWRVHRSLIEAMLKFRSEAFWLTLKEPSLHFGRIYSLLPPAFITTTTLLASTAANIRLLTITTSSQRHCFCTHSNCVCLEALGGTVSPM